MLAANSPAGARIARRIAVCIGTEKPTAWAHSSAPGSQRLDRQIEAADLVPGASQRGRRRGHVQRLVTELVGRDQQDAHGAHASRARTASRRARLDHDLEPGVRGAQRALDLRRASRRGRTGSRGSDRPRAAAARGGRGRSRSQARRCRAPPAPRPGPDLPQHARVGDREHHHAGRRRLAAQVVERRVPSAWRRITSSRLTPTPKRSEREHSPPIERAASSSTHTRSRPTRSSAWIGPSRSPSAARRPRGNGRDLARTRSAAATASRRSSPRSTGPRGDPACRTPPAPRARRRAGDPRRPPRRPARSAQSAAAPRAAPQRRRGSPGPARPSSARARHRRPGSRRGSPTATPA